MSSSSIPVEPILEARHVSMVFDGRRILHDINLSIVPRERVALVGGFDSGKSVLLRILAGLMKPTTGDLYLGGDRVSSYDPWGVPWRRPVGYVSQNHGLRSNMTASENISLPLIYLNQMKEAEALSTARTFLARIGIEGGNRRPSELSPGERGLVALCRALILEPAILLFDEPTVVLDVDHAERVMGVLEEMRNRIGLAIVGACTSESVAKIIGSRIIWLKNGGLEENGA